MNLLSIDFGTKKIGVAYSVGGVISTLPVSKTCFWFSWSAFATSKNSKT